MQLIESWKSSLAIFKPKNFKLFMLVTLKATIETYQVWLKYYGGIITFIGIVIYFSWPPANLSQVSSLSLSDILYLFLFPIPLFSLFLAIRPSVAKKNITYFASYTRYLLPFILWFMGFFLIGYYLEYRSVLLNVLFVFISFFWLDSDGSFRAWGKSLWRGVKMFVYNLPFCIITSVLFKAINWAMFFGLSALVHNFVSVQGIIVAMTALILPLPLCFIANFYTKKVHDQFSLYQ